jgi:hypothetical protein
LNGQAPSAIVTIDVDWAPDFMIRAVAKMLLEASVRSTWFVTHRSEAVHELREKPELFELGIHPNFLEGSSHGRTPEEVIKHCMDLVPEAVCMRTHALVQSTPLLESVVRLSPVRTDVSLFLPGVPAVGPLVQHAVSASLLRVPYSWEDDDEMARPRPCWDYTAHLVGSGPVIFDFHPVHVYLNSSSFEPYRLLKSRKPSFSELSPADAEPYVNSDAGAGTMFRALLRGLHSQHSMRVNDLAESVRA